MTTTAAQRSETGDAGGLSSSEAAERLARDGPNEIPHAGRRSLLLIVREVLSEPMFLLLIAAGVIYFVLGDVGEAIMLMAFANLSILIAVVQQTRSERVLDALRELSAPTSNVIRDGRQQRIPARDLVVDDLLLVREGDSVPADARLSSGAPVEVDESLLTGESVPVRKRNWREGDTLSDTAGSDEQPWMFAGTHVVRGQGRAVVTATGAASAIGRIGASLESIRTPPARLQAQTRALVRVFGIAGLALSTLVVALYVILHGRVVDALLAGIAVAMSLLPEEFPLILAVFTVMGAWRISRARVLTRRAAAIESLGAASVLCTDKTGTLTVNHMTIIAIKGAGPKTATGALGWNRSDAAPAPPVEARPILEAALLASSRDPIDPMDRAVHELAATVLGDPAEWLGTRALLQEFGLSPDLPAMTTISSIPDSGSAIAAAKGAPEAVTALCRMSREQSDAVKEEVERMAEAGIRVLAVAQAHRADDERPKSPQEIPFEYLGLIGFADPVRENVPAAVKECQRAGVRVVMITGDYPATARAIARQAGIESGDLMTGPELAALAPDELAQRIRSCSVFARIVPEQKFAIVDALSRGGDTVAMTGDGVNDAPALRAAHIGIAMGKRGTDVARQAASIVLLDDDFQSIVRTLKLGRRIHDNLRKAMGYVVALHIPIAGLALLPLLLGLPLILTPTMIAFLEMIIDPVCSVVFEAEPAEADTMSRPPRDPKSAILPPSLLAWCALQGAVALALVSAVFLYAVMQDQPEREVRSVVFASLVTTNIALIFTNRSFSGSIAVAFGRANSLVWWTVALAGGLLTLVLVWEPARDLFRLGPMHREDIAICLAGGVVVFLVLQSLKGLWKGRLAT